MGHLLYSELEGARAAQEVVEDLTGIGVRAANLPSEGNLTLSFCCALVRKQQFHF